MGWRYRKSINLGGGFRINLSKSGIGYSWGFPGYRVTKTANGKTRKTYSIPGTGISYMEERGNKKTGKTPVVNYDENTKLQMGETTYYKNTNLDKLGKEDEILIQINKVKNINLLANICMASIVFLIIGIILKVLIAKKWKIKLDYEFDEYSKKKYESLNTFITEIAKNKRIWQIKDSTIVYNTKYNSGAGSNVTRNIAFVKKSLPWYIDRNIEVYGLRLQTETIYFTPDRMIIFRPIGRVSGRNYKNLYAEFNYTNFVETEPVPRDAKVDHYTWRYVNKSGGPDKRFQNNKQIPVCKYGKITLKTDDGINIVLHCSNADLVVQMENEFEKFMDYNNQEMMSHECFYNIDEEMEIINENNDNNANIEQIETPNEIEQEDVKNDINEEQAKEEKQEIVKKLKQIIGKMLKGIIIVFTSFMILVSLMYNLYLTTLLCSATVLLFIPKIKDFLINKCNLKSKVINIARVMLFVICFVVLTIGLPMPFEGTWKSEDNEIVVLNKGEAQIILSDGIKLDGEYKYSLYDETNYKIVITLLQSTDKFLGETIKYNYEIDNNKIRFYLEEDNKPIKFFLPEEKLETYEYLTE